MSNNLIRYLVRRVLLEQSSERHLCLDGNFVSIDSQECYDDICKRIEDAKETRNMCSMQSDAREHYNGILKVLRRKQRKAKKHIESLYN